MRTTLRRKSLVRIFTDTLGSAMPQHIPPYVPQSSTPVIKPWEEILREIQREWSENYQVNAPQPQPAPVPVNIVRSPGC